MGTSSWVDPMDAHQATDVNSTHTYKRAQDVRHYKPGDVAQHLPVFALHLPLTSPQYQLHPKYMRFPMFCAPMLNYMTTYEWRKETQHILYSKQLYGTHGRISDLLGIVQNEADIIIPGPTPHELAITHTGRVPIFNIGLLHKTCREGCTIYLVPRRHRWNGDRVQEILAPSGPGNKRKWTSYATAHKRHKKQPATTLFGQLYEDDGLEDADEP